jgi:hypothetical protein
VEELEKVSVGFSVSSVFWVPCANCAQRGDTITGEAGEQVISSFA